MHVHSLNSWMGLMRINYQTQVMSDQLLEQSHDSVISAGMDASTQMLSNFLSCTSGLLLFFAPS